MRYTATSLGTIFSLTTLALIIAALCTPWMTLDGRINGQPRYTVDYHLTKITDKQTQPNGDYQERTVAAFTRAKEIRDIGVDSWTNRMWKNYNSTATVFAFGVVSALAIFMGIVFMWCKKTSILGVVFCFVSLVLNIVALIVFFAAVSRYYILYYTGQEVLLEYGKGLWMYFVATFASLWAGTTAALPRTEKLD